jgi:hypothetical protein
MLQPVYAAAKRKTTPQIKIKPDHLGDKRCWRYESNKHVQQLKNQVGVSENKVVVLEIRAQ